MRASRQPSQQIAPQIWSQMRILVVDDNVTMRRIVRSMLYGFGIRDVLEAENGATGFDMFLLAGPDLVITDLHMPVMDGIRLTALLRKEGWSRDPFVPVIMMSVHTERTRITQMWRAGVNDILAKPFSAATLRLRLVTALVTSQDFVECGTYFGPDRRRNSADSPNPDVRIIQSRPALERIVERSNADTLSLPTSLWDSRQDPAALGGF